MSNKAEQTIRILGIESSCDETAAAVVENGQIILSNIVASQIDLHAQFGGVFPEMASREHIKAVYPVVEQALKQAHLDLSGIDAIAVTRGPGLPGSLVVGINMAKGLSLGSDIPLIGVNHMEGHLYSPWLETNEDKPAPSFPFMALIVSGGHTELVLVRDHLDYERLGGTQDDAAGEAFDKVARLLKLGYPGGPAIQKISEEANKNAFRFPRSWMPGTHNFSFSGIKTAVLRLVNDMKNRAKKVWIDTYGVQNIKNFDPDTVKLPVADIAASFQESVVDVLVTKTIKAAEEHGCEEILIAGGVSANKALRETMVARFSGKVHVPPLYLCTDNAAMIATAGYYRFLNGQRDGLDFDALPTWSIASLQK